MKLGTSTAFHPVTPREIGPGQRCLVIAEFGLNHNGSRARAIDMVRAAAKAGCHAIKVQAFTPEEFCDPAETYTYQQRKARAEDASIWSMETVTEKQLDLFRRCHLAFEDLQAIRDEVRKLGLYWVATATDADWIRAMMTLGVDALKVGSDDLTHTPLLRTLRRTGLPVILSTGMGNAKEIKTAVEESGAAALLHCISLYPTKALDANLGRMDALRAFGMPVGFSDHTDSLDASWAAIARGACIIEKHFTLDRNLPGPDHWFSADQQILEALCAWAAYCGHITKTTGLDPHPEEKEMARLARRSIVAEHDIPAFRILDYGDLTYRRPGTGMSPASIDLVVGQVTAVAVPAGTQITPGVLLPPYQRKGGTLAN